MDTAAKIATGLISFIMILLWGQILLAPENVAEAMHLLPKGAAGLNTFRADVGGILLGTGVLSLIGLKTKNHQWLLAACIMMVCAALGRFTGIVLDGSTPSSIGSMMFELFIAVLLFSSAQRFKKITG